MSIINRLIDNIKNNNEIKIGVAAIMLHGMKPLGDVCGNSSSNYCRGLVCPSIHAEVKAVTTFFGKNITYSPKHGWVSSCIKKAEEFKYHGD